MVEWTVRNAAFPSRMDTKAQGLYFRKPVRFIFLTDGPSIEQIELVWQEELPPFPLYNEVNVDAGNATKVSSIVVFLPYLAFILRLHIDGVAAY